MKKKSLIKLGILFIVGLLCITFMPNTKAINNGDSVSYSSWVQNESSYASVKFSVAGGYIGSCIHPDIDRASSGTATMTKVTDSDWIKAAYYFAIKLNWQEGLGLPFSSSENGAYLQNIMQYFAGNLMDASEVSSNRKQLIRTMVTETYYSAWKNITVPTGFELYKGAPTGGRQPFVVWRFAPFSASKTYASDTPSGLNGATVKAGDEIKYQIKWENGSGTITDTLSKGLSYVSGSASLGEPTVTNNSDGTTTLKWTATQTSGTLTYKAKVALDICTLGIYQVQNNANMAVDGTNHKLGELKNPVPSKCYASDTSSGKAGASVAIGNTIKYAIKYANTTSSSSNATITDTISKGLSYVSGSAKVGSTVVNPTITNNSDGTTTLTWTRTLAANATEELKYEVKVTDAAAGNKVCNNATVTIGNKVVLTPLCNPVPSKTYGGSSLSDNPGWNHHEVKVGQDIKYSIKLPNVKTSAQTIVVTDVLSKGLTYNSDMSVTNGSVVTTVTPRTNSDTKETTLVWTISVPAGKTAVLNYSAKVNDDAVNLVNNNASCQYGTDPSIKLAELHNPVPTKKYDVDTANGMNGKIVQKDDVITYNISYANPYKSEATINLRDTLSKGLTYKAGTAKVCDYNKENCKSLTELGITEKVTVKNNGKTEILWTRTNMPSLGVEIIVYDVEVTGETIRVENDFDIKTCKETESTNQTIQIPDCVEQINKNCAPLCDPTKDKNCKSETDNECTSSKQECSVTGLVCSNPWMDIEELKNPVPVKEYAEDTPSGYGETAVAVGNRIKYRIRYANVAEEKVTVTIKDTLSKGITYIKGTSKVGDEAIADPQIKGQQLTWTRELEKNKEEALTYEVMVTGETSIVNNNACMIYGNNPDYERCLIKLYNPVPQKTYAKDTKAGMNGATVKKNDVISYSIKYSNVKKEKQTIIITDNLSKGLEYQKGTAKINGKVTEPDSVTKDANGTMLIWMTELEAGGHAELVYGAKVTGEKMIVENNANIQYGHDPVIHLNELRNPLIKNEIVNVPDTGSKVAIAGVIAGVLLVSGGGFLVYRRYKKA